MNVKLIAITKPLILELSIDEFIAYVARVSNPSNQNNNLTAPKLLKYLISHEHFSPFEMASLTMEIQTTRDIGRQILRHRSFSFQEFSQRYAEVVGDFELREARLQDPKNRQNSIPTENEELKKVWENYQRVVSSISKGVYDWALKNGIAKEQARAVLPEGLTPTRMYMAGTLRSWIHYCALRSANGTQEEHKEIAKAAFKIVLEQFPSLKELFQNQ